jgi:hypothetical protein
MDKPWYNTFIDPLLMVINKNEYMGGCDKA